MKRLFSAALFAHTALCGSIANAAVLTTELFAYDTQIRAYANTGVHTGGTLLDIPTSPVSTSSIFEQFDSSLGTIISATLSYRPDIAYYAYGTSQDIGSDFYGFRSAYEMSSSYWLINATDSLSWVLDAEAATPGELYCSSNNNAGAQQPSIDRCSDTFQEITTNGATYQYNLSGNWLNELENAPLRLQTTASVDFLDLRPSSGDSGTIRAYANVFARDAVIEVTYEAAATVPLPAGAWLFGSALIGLAGIKRKK